MRGAEELGGDAGDQTARNQALDLGAKIVAGTGDDIAFAGGKRLQADASHFVSCLLPAIRGRDLRLIGDFTEFGLRGTRAQRADANAMSFDLFRQSLREEEIEALGSGVGGDVGDGLKGRS